MPPMPVIVVGADTPTGEAVVRAVCRSAAETRAFVSDIGAADGLRAMKVKAALGDVSDASHVEAAALHCFCAVLVVEAAEDGRERAFANSPAEVIEGWAEAVRNAGVQRVIWVGGENLPAPLPPSAPEAAAVSVEGAAEADLEAAARRVVRLESARRLTA